MLNENLQYPSDFNSEVKDATAHLYKGVEKIIPEVEWPFHAPLIHEINKLKKEKNIFSSQFKIIEYPDYCKFIDISESPDIIVEKIKSELSLNNFSHFFIFSQNSLKSS